MKRSDRAELVETIHQPWRAIIGEGLDRWRRLDAPARSTTYLVMIEDQASRRTLNATKIAELVAVALAA